jgi:hypothetical protein
MTINVELVVFDPTGAIDVERRVGELPRQHRREVQARRNHRL